MRSTSTPRLATSLTRLLGALAIASAGLGAAIAIDADPSAATESTTDRAGVMLVDGRADLPVIDRLLVSPPVPEGEEPAPTPEPKHAATRRTTPQPGEDRLYLVTPPEDDDRIAIDAPLKALPQCPGSGALPADATNHSLSAADVDGDGDADTLHGYVVDGQGYVMVSFTGGGGATLAVDPGFAPMVAPRPSLGHDLDGDGDEEFTVRVAGGIGGVTSAVVDVVDCTLHLTTIDGEVAELHTRATIGARSGFMCTHEEGTTFLHVWDLLLLAPEDLDEPQDGDVYGGPRSMYRLVDGELLLQGVSEAFEIPGEYDLGEYSTCDNLLPA